MMDEIKGTLPKVLQWRKVPSGLQALGASSSCLKSIVAVFNDSFVLAIGYTIVEVQMVFVILIGSCLEIIA